MLACKAAGSSLLKGLHRTASSAQRPAKKQDATWQGDESPRAAAPCSAAHRRAASCLQRAMVAVDVELSMLQDVSLAGCLNPLCVKHFCSMHRQGPQAAARLAAGSCKSAAPMEKDTGPQLFC